MFCMWKYLLYKVIRHLRCQHMRKNRVNTWLSETYIKCTQSTHTVISYAKLQQCKTICVIVVRTEDTENVADDDLRISSSGSNVDLGININNPLSRTLGGHLNLTLIGSAWICIGSETLQKLPSEIGVHTWGLMWCGTCILMSHKYSGWSVSKGLL